MKNIKMAVILIGLIILLIPILTCAKASKDFKEAFAARFTPSEPQRGLETAAVPLRMDKLRTFVVVEKGGVIPAERAYYVISPSDYDYRGARVEGDIVKTRSGEVYTYLPRGTVMAVADVTYSGDWVYLRLISMKSMHSEFKPKLKPTRVTVMLGFKFDKETLQSGDAAAVFPKIEDWVKPFDTLAEAGKYGDSIAQK